MGMNRRTYDDEFKRNAALMIEESGRNASEVAESLRIGVDFICRWRREMRKKKHIAFPGRGKQALTDNQHRIRELEKKLRDV